MVIQLPNDFKEFLSLLAKHSVDYLLLGGYAVNYYGYVRNTGNIDFLVRCDENTASKLVLVLEDFGFSSAGLKEKLLDTDALIRMGVPPFRIELMTSADGLNFDEAFANGVQSTIDGTVVRIISLDDLKTNKRSTGRLKDLSDLENLP